ncbi:MAG: sigma-54 dependent transcriptional regulator [Deltaproteobacteria bacterium]|nr:sigma-54 dependent transcriptional regulator [Deltaproteobacteria bacterium]
MASILIVDDNESIRVTLSILLKNAGHEVFEAKDGREAIERLKGEPYDLVITDLKMGKIGGMEVVKAARASIPPIEVIVVTAYGSIETAVKAVKIGAFDFITKTFETNELLHVVERALERRSFISEVKHAGKAVTNRYSPDSIICKSQGMRKVLDLIERVCEAEATVLISGESGVGKELVAKAIHNNSQRSKGSFVALNCAGLPESLLESELFGHVKGAFTGATANKCGLFEEANGGTIFLDEVGDMPLPIQANLLRVLQEREVRSVGSSKTRKIDVRVISASNQELQELVNQGLFRKDLFYRLNTVNIPVPPLRERREDILPLLDYFLEIYSEKMGRTIPSVSKELIDLLTAYDWPGNVREFGNAVENMLVISKGDYLSPEDLPPYIIKITELKPDLESSASFKSRERSHILESLEKHAWNRTKVAEELGIGRNTLWRKMRAYNIVKE